MCAQSVWGILWQAKKALLDELFRRDVDLDLYSACAACGDAANHYWLAFVDAQTDYGAVGGGGGAAPFAAATLANGGGGVGAAALPPRTTTAGAAAAALVRGLTISGGGTPQQQQQQVQSTLSKVARSGLRRLTRVKSAMLSGGGGGSAAATGDASGGGGGAAPRSLASALAHLSLHYERLKLEPEVSAREMLESVFVYVCVCVCARIE